MTAEVPQADEKMNDRYARRSASGALLLPGGYGRSAYHVGKTPPYAIRGEGWRMWDDAGREVIDANGNFTTLIHGNAHPEIVEAAEREVRRGAVWGVPNPVEWELAEAMLGRLPGLDQIRFTNSGTEAVMSAFRIARAFTGRDDVIMTKDGFHGTSDLALMASGPSHGVPASVAAHVELVKLGDIEALRALFAESPNRFAAIVLDLLPNKAGLLQIPAEFVQEARALASAHGTLLIIDEIISLRLGFNGFSGTYGVTPDLLTAGKIIGGGFPVGAVAGSAEVMSVLDPWVPGTIPHSGTFSGNPVTAAAGAVALNLLTAAEIDRLNALGDRAREGLRSRVAPLGWEVRGVGSLFRLFPEGVQKVPEDLQQRLWWQAYEQGVVLSSANLASLSTPMDEVVIDDIVERLTVALGNVVEGGK